MAEPALTFADRVLAEQAYLLRVAGKLLGKTMRCHDIDDMVQDTIMKALEQMHQYRIDANLRQWLIVILVNLIRSRYKQNNDRARLSFKIGFVNETPPSQYDAICLREVLAALRCLPVDQRTAILAVVAHGQKPAAAQLGVPLGTIRSRTARGRAALQLGGF